MMTQIGRFRCLDTDDFQLLEMPYKGKEVSMLVLLPHKSDGLSAIEKTLTAAKLSKWIEDLHEREVQVYFPKFRTTVEFTLNDVLGNMGMKTAFTNAADFSGMNGRTDLMISKVIHKAFVDVNEEGTEAATVTVVKMKEKGRPMYWTFRADHPFLFLIRDVRNVSILFLGRFMNP